MEMKKKSSSDDGYEYTDGDPRCDQNGHGGTVAQ